MSKTDAILQTLIDKGEQGATQQELNDIAYRYGSVIFRLRRAGHSIETVQLGVGHFKFVYHPAPTEKESVNAVA